VENANMDMENASRNLQKEKRNYGNHRFKDCVIMFEEAG